MNTHLKKAATAATFILILNTIGFAQFSVGLQGVRAKSNLSNAKKLTGLGVNLSYFVSPHLAVGGAFKIVSDNAKHPVGSLEYRYQGFIAPITGTVDYFLFRGFIRPYVGADAGVYLSRHTPELNGEDIGNIHNSTNFGIAPRIGILLSFGNFAIQVEGMKHFIFNNKTQRVVTNTGEVQLNSTSRFRGVNIGVIFGLGKKHFGNAK